MERGSSVSLCHALLDGGSQNGLSVPVGRHGQQHPETDKATCEYLSLSASRSLFLAASLSLSLSHRPVAVKSEFAPTVSGPDGTEGQGAEVRGYS